MLKIINLRITHKKHVFTMCLQPHQCLEVKSMNPNSQSALLLNVQQNYYND